MFDGAGGVNVAGYRQPDGRYRTGLSLGLTVVTSNLRDFQYSDLKVADPWEGDRKTPDFINKLTQKSLGLHIIRT